MSVASNTGFDFDAADQALGVIDCPELLFDGNHQWWICNDCMGVKKPQPEQIDAEPGHQQGLATVDNQNVVSQTAAVGSQNVDNQEEEVDNQDVGNQTTPANYQTTTGDNHNVNGQTAAVDNQMAPAVVNQYCLDPLAHTPGCSCSADPPHVFFGLDDDQQGAAMNDNQPLAPLPPVVPAPVPAPAPPAQPTQRRDGQTIGWPQALAVHKQLCRNPYRGCMGQCPTKNFPEKLRPFQRRKIAGKELQKFPPPGRLHKRFHTNQWKHISDQDLERLGIEKDTAPEHHVQAREAPHH